jgi:hypothetical protein
MVEFFTARSGAPSVRVDGLAMHSPYDPAREASRFVQEKLGGETPSAVIVLGECAGHVTEAVRRLKPGTLVLAAVYSEQVARGAPTPATPSWHPGNLLSFSDYLRDHLDELKMEGLRVLEWPPAAHAFPAVSQAVNQALRQVVQEINGSFVTTVAAGRLWLRNSIANFLHIPAVVSGRLCEAGRAILIAAPGPSLEDAAPLLRELRPRFELWALPSSCPFLADFGLSPDMVVMTDPGHYSMHHLHFAAASCPLAMPLSAARGAWSLPGAGDTPGVPVFLLEQPVMFEKALISAAGLVVPVIPPHGTVAATATDLALASTAGAVIVAGLDLGARDLLQHARPNAFDRLLQLQSGRFEPHESLTFHRAALLGATGIPGAPGHRSTPALRTYAGWFDSGTGAARRIHRLLPSAVPLGSMSPLDGPGLRVLLRGTKTAGRGPGLRAEPGFPSFEERRRIASGLLDSWIRETAQARDSFTGPAAAVDLGRFPRALALAQLIVPRGLVDALRKSRQGQGAAARSSAQDALTEGVRFLVSLAEKTRG